MIPDVSPTLISGPNSKASHGKKSGTDREVLIPVAELLCVATGQAGADMGADMAPTLNCNHEAPYIAGVRPTLRAGGNKTGGDRPPGTDVDTCDSLVVTHSLRGEGFDASEDGTGRGTPLVPVAATLEATAGRSRGAGTPVGMLLPFDTTQVTSAANRSNPQPGDPCHPIAAGAHAPCIATGISWQKSSMSTTLDKSTTAGVAIGWSEELSALEDIQPTIQRGGAGGRHEGVMSPSMQVRRLTPKECARLQGFPDDYLDITYRGKPAADGPKYKALGNSWATPCARWIGERIEAVEAIQAQQRKAA